VTPETLTLISGGVLLLVFALVGWSVRRRGAVRDRKSSGPDEKKSP
jgi:hypothetical protein